VRIGLQQCTYTWPGGPAAIADRLTEIARNAEAAGFASFWLMDHFQQVPGWGSASADPMLEAYTALGFVAAHTSRVKLGALVSAAVYRHPSVLIKAVTTLDVLSRGRAYLGVGAAWFEGEAKALGIPFPPRRARYAALEDVLRLARHSWSDGAARFEGATLVAEAPVQNPAPLSRPHPPILVGGRGRERTLALVVRYADAWNVIATPEEGPHFLAALRERCRAVDRDPREIEATVLDADDWRRDEDASYRWSPEWELARLRRWRAIGFDHVIVNMPDAHEPAKLRAYGEVIAELARDAPEPRATGASGASAAAR
jgi:F420-dependent oxidoreductase-like protein